MFVFVTNYGYFREIYISIGLQTGIFQPFPNRQKIPGKQQLDLTHPEDLTLSTEYLKLMQQNERSCTFRKLYPHRPCTALHPVLSIFAA